MLVVHVEEASKGSSRAHCGTEKWTLAERRNALHAARSANNAEIVSSWRNLKVFDENITFNIATKEHRSFSETSNKQFAKEVRTQRSGNGFTILLR